jgi:hypothetical protein
MSNSEQTTTIQLLIDKWKSLRGLSKTELYSLLLEVRANLEEEITSLKMSYLDDIIDLTNKVEELNKRIELLTPENLLAASRRVDDEVSQIPLKVSRTVDWRTKRQELEQKYAKEKIRDSLVKEISTPADIFKE